MKRFSTIRLIWESIKFSIKRRRCQHEWNFLQEIQGDYRRLLGGRYEYVCSKCGDTKYTDTAL